MPLYIRDDKVAGLAREIQKATGARSITDAVRTALEHEMERVRTQIPLRDHIRKYQAMVAAMGETDPTFDEAGQKTFFDTMWGDI